MSWVNDLASGLGISAGAATLAVAMYGACAAAEKAARPEALKDIGRILKDSSWERSVRPYAIIERLFNWTFGERHLSWNCVKRSAMATIIFCLTFAAIYHVALGTDFGPVLLFLGVPVATSTVRLAFGIGISVLLLGFLPDYLAIAKTRLLLNVFHNILGPIAAIGIIVIDTCLSIAVSFLTALGVFLGTDFIQRSVLSSPTFFASVIRGICGDIFDVIFGLTSINRLLQISSPEPYDIWSVASIIMQSMVSPFMGDRMPASFGPLFLSSALLTSIWTGLILLSTTVLKLLPPLQRSTAWFFDLERHPVQAIGIVAGALVMVGSLLWTVLWAVI